MAARLALAGCGSYRSSNRPLSFVAFYADCQHEVLPLTSGHRVALTYNLSLQGDSSAGNIDTLAVADVSSCLRTHFEAQDRLVYLLDHEYTEHGLSFERLKGVDAARVAVLRAAARERGDEIVLALADVHETWSCDEPYEHHSWYDEYDDDEAEPDSESYELGELLDGGTTLDAPIDLSGVPTQVGPPGVSDDEVCATTPSGQLEPYASEYEGYMGNYGNTMDRWYRRGAVVMWPRSHDFSVRAQGSPRWALAALGGLLRAKDLAGARDRAGSLAPFWDDVAGRQPEGLRARSAGASCRQASRGRLTLSVVFTPEAEDQLVASADLLDGLAGLVAVHNVDDVVGQSGSVWNGALDLQRPTEVVEPVTGRCV